MKFAIPIILLSFILLTGCFEVREEVDLYADGSGRVTLTLNLSESKANVANYMRLGSFNGQEVPTRQEIAEEIALMKKTLAACKGMSEVRSYSDFNNFIFSLSARFDKVENLNAAINKLAAVNAGKQQVQPFQNFGYASRVFRRHFEYPLELIDYQGLTTMQRYMLESARMVSVYRFEQPIKDFSNPRAQMAPNKRAIKLESTLGGLLNGSATLANAISF
jgi:hypothetical protein